MISLQAAELGIAAEGFDTPLFRQRTKEYAQKVEQPQLRISCEIRKELSKPEGIEIAAQGERHWLKSETGYAFYDSIPVEGREQIIASVSSNRDWSFITAELRDVESLGGASLEVRNFNLLGEVFRWFLPFHEGMVFHSSCLRCNGKAMAFSAPSGTGKSTHTGLWREYFLGVEMINDDSPAIRFSNGCMIAYGTPWSGKSDINHNISAPLAAIVFLEQAKENSLCSLSGKEAVFRLLRELARPVYPELLQMTLAFLEQMLEAVPAYLLKCNISREAAEFSHSLLEVVK